MRTQDLTKNDEKSRNTLKLWHYSKTDAGNIRNYRIDLPWLGYQLHIERESMSNSEDVRFSATLINSRSEMIA